MSKPGWLDIVEAVTLTPDEYSNMSWSFTAFLEKHGNRWIRYSKPEDRRTQWTSPASYMIKQWAKKAFSQALQQLGGYNRARDHMQVCSLAYKIATGPEFPVCEEFEHVWKLLTIPDSLDQDFDITFLDDMHPDNKPKYQMSVAGWAGAVNMNQLTPDDNIVYPTEADLYRQAEIESALLRAKGLIVQYWNLVWTVINPNTTSTKHFTSAELIAFVRTGMPDDTLIGKHEGLSDSVTSGGISNGELDRVLKDG